MAGETVPEADPDDVRELLNYRRAFDFVSEYLSSGLPAEVPAQAGAPITEGLIREIHKRLVEGVRGGAAAPWEYRKIQNYVVNSATGETIYTSPPAHEVAILMAELVKWLNRERETHPVLVSGIAQFQLVHIHPFMDGNGRTSRLLSTLCLYRAGYDFKRLFTIKRVLRPGPGRLLPGDSGRPGMRHGHDRVAGVLRGRTGHPADGGQATGGAGDPTRRARPTARSLPPPGPGPDAHPRTREHQHSGIRGALPGSQPAHTSAGAEEHGGERSSRYRRGDQSADIPPQRIGGRTCDKLATQLTTYSRHGLRHPAQAGRKEIRINTPAGRQDFRALGDVPFFEKMFRINALGDIPAVESGCEEGCSRGDRKFSPGQ